MLEQFTINDLNEKTRDSFLKTIEDDPRLSRNGFLNRVVSSIEFNGIKFTANIYNLDFKLVNNISVEFNLTEKSKNI